MDIYGHLFIADEVLKSNDLDFKLRNLLLDKKNYFNLGNFLPDLQYIIVRLMLFMVLKNILFGVRDYRKITKKTNLEHIRSSDIIINAFKTVDDSIRYYDRDIVIENSAKAQKQIALLMGLIGHIMADRYIHYIIESIQFEYIFDDSLKSEKINHQQVEISLSYYLLKSKDLDWYNFSDDIKIPLSKKWWRKILLVRDEAIHSMIQQMDLITFGDSMSDNEINMALNNLVIFGNYLKYFSIYRKIKKGKYIFDFDTLNNGKFHLENILSEINDKLIPLLAKNLNLVYKLLLEDGPYSGKINKLKMIFGNVDASKPEEPLF